MSYILPSVVPLQVTDNCGDVKPLDCGDGVTSDVAAKKLKVEFPNFVNGVFPLAGGAVVSLGVSDLKIKTSENIADIISRDLSELSNLQLTNTLEDLSKARLAINNAYLNIARKNIRVVSEQLGGQPQKRKAPELFISKFDGDDRSVLIDGVSNPEINKICELRFIPKEILEKTAEILSEYPEFKKIIGCSGVSFAGLSDSSQALSLTAISAESLLQNKDTAINLVLEFFPIFNIDENDITKKSGSPVLGGFYTIIDDNIYFKTPDLSGRDSSGNSNGFITSETPLFVEVRSGGKITRVDIEDFKHPPIGRLVTATDDFPDSGVSLDIEIELIAGDGNIEVYLSPIYPVSPGTKKSLDLFANNSEIFSIPMLTTAITDGEGRQATLNDSIQGIAPLKETFETYASLLARYVGTIDPILGYSDYGYPYFGSINAQIFYGEKNRPEILLADTDNDRTNNKNNQRYLDSKSMGALEILSSNRPKLYKSVPQKWIKATSSIDNSTENLIASFSSSKFTDVDLSALGGSITYAVYIGDSIGQITKVIGQNITLTTAKPKIEKITPNGFYGGPLLRMDSGFSIKLVGEDLGSKNNFDKVVFVSEAGVELSIPGSDSNLSISSSSVFVNIPNPLATGFFGNQEYKVYVVVSGQISNEVPIYVSLNIDTIPPISSPVLAVFDDNELKFSDFGKRPASGIPLLKDGQSASIRIKSKSKIFTGNEAIFGYLAFDQDDIKAKSAVSKFSLPENLKLLNNAKYQEQVVNLVIPQNIEYNFSTSLFSDFFKVSNKNAILKFPGNQFSKYNFSGLSDISGAYIILVNKSIGEASGGTNIATLGETDYAILKLGDDEKPAFIDPPVVLGLAADIGAAVGISSTFTSSTFLGFTDKNIFNGGLVPGEINAFEKINRIAVVISGVDERLLSKRYTVKLAGDSIQKKLSRRPDILNNKKTLVLTFDNVTPKTHGVIAVSVEKNDKIFNVTSSSEFIYRQGTAVIKSLSDNYSITDQTGELILNQDIALITDGTDLITFLGDSNKTAALIGSESISDINNKAELLFKQNTGILFNEQKNTEFQFKTFLPMDILPSVKIALGLDPEDSGNENTIDSIFSAEDKSVISKTVLSVKSGARFDEDSYELSRNEDSALLFFNTRINKGASIKFNLPEIVKIGRGEIGVGAPLADFTSETVIPLVVGEKITVEVKNTDRDFIVKFNEVVLKTRGRPAKVSRGVYRAVVEIPSALIGIAIATGKCFEICVSTSNSDRNRAKLALGRSFVVDLQKEYQDLILGKLKEAMPDVQGLIQKLADAPLQFVNLILDKALIAKDLINSFCDLSFHLLAELKINLNGFRILMIPIQVILCIIDVICALLNPIKLAKAVIRLFQCLYDLILLLPQISIPAMFIRLILHLLELLECVIEKILFLITAINEISKAITRAITDKNWSAIKALEEVLSEYLFEIEADLQFLEPVVSILAMFLQLLQLAFRFPCEPSTGSGTPSVCIDGSMLAGIVGGIVAPDLEILPDALIPVAQTYSIAEDGSTSALYIVSPAAGDIIATSSSDSTYLDSMFVDADSIRGTKSGTGSIDFNATFAPTITKSKKGFGKTTKVRFEFKGRAKTIIKEKYIDPNQTLDMPLGLMSKDNSKLSIALNGNFISPIDGETFITVNGDTATVKPLIIDFETPILEVDDTTGQVIQVGTETISRTFDDIPRMAIMDEEFNLYFIESSGIEFNNDGLVESIVANLVSNVAAHKLKLSKEEQEIDTNDDDVVNSDDDGDTIDIFDFPQIYFVDLRQCAQTISEACSTSSINTFVFDLNDSDEIETIVTASQECINQYLSDVRSMISTVRVAQQNGEALPIIDVDKFKGFNSILQGCLNESVSSMCRYVVNSLNTSFKVLNDTNDEPLPGFVDGSLEDGSLDGLEAIDPPFTGAREYAAGDGDSATLGRNEIANISIIPRDSYDIEMGGDLTDNINIEIISDSTGVAEFIKNSEGKIITKTGFEYTAELTSSKSGEVKIKASICDRTIQAVTFEGTQSQASTSDPNVIDCIPDATVNLSGAATPLGALTKVDRILTVFFVKKSLTIISQVDSSGNASPETTPQEFGTRLEN